MPGFNSLRGINLFVLGPQIPRCSSGCLRKLFDFLDEKWHPIANANEADPRELPTARLAENDYVFEGIFEAIIVTT